MENIFTRLEWLFGKENVEKLHRSTVIVVGIGGVGGYVCEALSRSGVGTLILIDFDTVDVTNINRQIIATTRTIGKKKVDVMRKRIKEINPSCNVITHDFFLNEGNINLVNLSIADYVIDCCDSLPTKKKLLTETVKRNVNFISSMGTANKIDPTKLQIVELAKTYNDPIARIMRKYAKEKKIKQKIMVLSSTELPKKNGKLLGSNAFVPSSAGLIIASYVVNQLIK